MIRLRQALLACAAVLSIAAGQAAPAPSAAPPPAAQDEPTEVSEVTVTAAPVDQISDFVGDISAPTLNGKLPRWDRKICPGVLGLKAKHAQFLLDRMAAIAFAVGLDVGDPGCRPNIMIFVTNDSQGFAADAVKRYPNVFGKYNMEDHVYTRGKKALAEFVATPRPVRWWHVSRLVSADGTPIQGQNLRVRDASRIRSNVRTDFDKLIVIVDAKMAGGVSFQSLSDYIAMISLAQINPDYDVSAAPSILNLFVDRDAKRTPESGVTNWDLAYLKGLYTANPDTINTNGQKKRIVDRMKKGGGDPDPNKK